MIPGEVISGSKTIECNSGLNAIELEANNSSWWPIQVCSHYHFFEVNRRLLFDRAKTFGLRLDVVAGGGVRWEPRETKRVRLVPLRGAREAWGFNGMASGSTTAERLPEALDRARERGFLSEL